MVPKGFLKNFLTLTPHPLTNFEIQEYYQNEPRFNGVFSRDNLPNNSNNNNSNNNNNNNNNNNLKYKNIIKMNLDLMEFLEEIIYLIIVTIIIIVIIIIII